jgi:hypothetical protein
VRKSTRALGREKHKPFPKCTGFKTLLMDEDQNNNFKQGDILPSKRLPNLAFVT